MATDPYFFPAYYTIVHTLASDEGINPTDNMTVGPDGNLYGAASRGGSAADCGTLFRITPSGVFTKLVTFDGSNGCHPNGALAVGSDGSLYGTTQGFDPGIVFRLDPSGALTQLAAFSTDTSCTGPLTRASDDNFYCTGGASVIKVTPAGVLTELARLPSGTYEHPHLVQASDGNLYGIRNHLGVDDGIIADIYKVSLSGVVTDVAPVPGSSHGPGAGSGLSDGADGYLYFTADALMRIKVGGNATEGVALWWQGSSRPFRASDGNMYGEVYRGLVDGPPMAIAKLTSHPAATGTTYTSSLQSYEQGGSRGLIEGPDGYLYGALQSTYFSPSAIYRVHRPTNLVAKGIVTVEPIAGKAIFNPQATLTDAMSKAPVRGANVTFFSGQVFLCSGYTDSSGLAKCQASVVDHVDEIVYRGYHAFFADDGTYLPSDGAGGLVCLGTICH